MFQKFLSSFLALLFVAYTVLFSVDAGMHNYVYAADTASTTAVVDTSISTKLYYPLDNVEGTLGEGVQTSSACTSGQVFVQDMCTDQGNSDINQAPVCSDGKFKDWENQTCVTGDVLCGKYDAVWSGQVKSDGTPDCNYVTGDTCGEGEEMNESTGECQSDEWLKQSMLGVGTNQDLINGAVPALWAAAADGLLGEVVFDGLLSGANIVSDFLPDMLGGVIPEIGVGVGTALLTLFMGGDIKDAAVAGVKSAAIHYVADIAATALVNAFGTAGSLLGIPGVGWAIAIGFVLSMLFCPISYIDLPNGEAGGFTTFLVGKINKHMEGESIERFNLSADQLSLLNNQENSKLNIVIGEIVPEILYLNAINVLDIQSSIQEQGEWFFNQFGEAEFFGENEGVSWNDKKQNDENELINAITWGLNNSDLENKKLADFSSKNNEFNINIQSNEDIKILVEGGITSVYHEEKFRLLAKFKPILYWFYVITDNTKLGEIVEREIYAKEGFILEEKINDQWELVHQWVTYPDQGRVICVKASVNKNRELRIRYKNEYLSINNVRVSTEENPEFILQELISDNLPETLKEVDEQYEIIETGTHNTYFFNLPKIDETIKKRTLFLQSEGYYHPMDTYESLQEIKEQENWWKEKIEKLSLFEN